MNISTEQAASRPVGVAQELLQRPINEAIVYSKIVILTGEPAVLATANGRWCFLDALALLSRIVGHLVVAVPQETKQLRQEVSAYCDRAWSHKSITVIDAIDSTLFQGADAILNVGAETRPGLPWSSINSNGWIARVSSNEWLPADTEQPNAIAALMAASLGVTEVFKRIFDIPEEVAPLLSRTEFSLYELSTSSRDLGPQLPTHIRFRDTLLTGAGAIGNAVALLLAQLGVEGRLHIVDRQRYRDENMGTCMLMEKSNWLNQPKALRLAEWMNMHSSLVVSGDEITIEAAIAEQRLAGLVIDMILNALDDVEARRNTQRLWPSIIVDGGINEVGAAVIEHRLDGPAKACIMCWFAPPMIDEKALQGSWTGLHQDSLKHANRQLTEADISAADESKRDWLRERQRERKTVCSIITEAQLAFRLGVAANHGFRPSVPFVASASAALVVAAAVKAHVFPDAPTPSMFQVGSLFLGPDHSARLDREASEHCQCVRQRAAIEQLRHRRIHANMS